MLDHLPKRWRHHLREIVQVLFVIRIEGWEVLRLEVVEAELSLCDQEMSVTPPSISGSETNPHRQPRRFARPMMRTTRNW